MSPIVLIPEFKTNSQSVLSVLTRNPVVLVYNWTRSYPVGVSVAGIKLVGVLQAKKLMDGISLNFCEMLTTKGLGFGRNMAITVTINCCHGNAFNLCLLTGVPVWRYFSLFWFRL